MAKPDHNFTAAFLLFHQWVFWRVPEYATITAYDSQEHGLFLPEDPKKANAILLNKKSVYMCPSHAAVYAASGGSLDITDPKDAILVYGWIMDHLIDWLRYMEQPHLITRPVPMEGLRQFNALAGKLFPVANRHGYFKRPEKTMKSAVQALFGEVKDEPTQHRFNDTVMRRIEKIYRQRGGML